jgi:hypothetical protein
MAEVDSGRSAWRAKFKPMPLKLNPEEGCRAAQLAAQQQRALQREAARLQDEAAAREISQQPLLLRSRSQQVRRQLPSTHANATRRLPISEVGPRPDSNRSSVDGSAAHQVLGLSVLGQR